MKLLITTSFSLLEVNMRNRNINRIHNGKGLYYGIAKSNDNFFVAARNRMVSSSTALKEERGEILVFDLDFNLTGSISPPFPLRDMHEIAWYNDKLWVTCSYDNFIAIWDGYEWEQWFPLPEDKNGLHDIHHYNSFLFETEHLWLLAHNQGASELFAFSYRNRALIKSIKIGNQAHNIWQEGGQLFTFSSADGKIMGEDGFVLGTGGFPRGYLRVANRRFVGINEPAERQARDCTTSHILMFNDRWKLLEKLQLPDEGMILDIGYCST